MNIKLPFIVDPKDDKPSVSLTILILSVVSVMTAFGLHIAGKVEGTSISLEFFGIAASLYFGRRFGYKQVAVEAEEKK